MTTALLDEITDDPASLGYATLVADRRDADLALLLNAPRAPVVGKVRLDDLDAYLRTYTVAPDSPVPLMWLWRGTAAHPDTPEPVRMVVQMALDLFGSRLQNLDLSLPTVQVLLAQMQAAGLLSADNVAAVTAMGTTHISRAQLLFGRTITHDEISAALNAQQVPEAIEPAEPEPETPVEPAPVEEPAPEPDPAEPQPDVPIDPAPIEPDPVEPDPVPEPEPEPEPEPTPEPDLAPVDPAPVDEPAPAEPVAEPTPQPEPVEPAPEPAQPEPAPVDPAPPEEPGPAVQPVDPEPTQPPEPAPAAEPDPAPVEPAEPQPTEPPSAEEPPPAEGTPA